MFRLLLTSVVSVALLTACGKGDSPKSSFPPIRPPTTSPNFKAPINVDPATFLEQFPVLNSAGEQAAYAHDDFQGYPLGVLIIFKGGNEIGFCTVSHLDPGYVATNAHCVDNWQTLGPERFWVVYFSPDGLKKFSAIDSFVYVGSSSSDDVALLKIPQKAADEWATAGKAVKQVPVATATPDNPSPTPVAFSVHVWAFDPFSPSHPNIVSVLGDTGMIFQPRTCMMTRTRPTLIGSKVPDTGPVLHTTITASHSQADMHFFLDQCDRMPVHGNSGSLVTVDAHFDEKVGVFHWGSGVAENKTKYDYIEFTGSDGRTKFIHDEKQWPELFGTGYLFQHFSAKHPNVLF